MQNIVGLHLEGVLLFWKRFNSLYRVAYCTGLILLVQTFREQSLFLMGFDGTKVCCLTSKPQWDEATNDMRGVERQLVATRNEENLKRAGAG